MTHFSIPDAVLKQHIAIVGKTGSGKTSTEKLAVEQVVESGARVCDPDFVVTGMTVDVATGCIVSIEVRTR